MPIKKITSLYFSPNGRTKEVVNKIASCMGAPDIEEIDLTSAESRSQKRTFGKDELLIIGMPVYSDRLPRISKEIFKNIRGNNTLAVALVIYGNRDYGDALLELKNELEAVNIRTVSAGAIIAQHCLNNNVATNRPDEKDYDEMMVFSNEIIDKIKKTEKIDAMKGIDVKGNYPYKPIKKSLHPTGDYHCVSCGLCEKKCPVQAIDKNDYTKTDASKCILCGACMDCCPTQSRKVREDGFENAMERLASIAKERKEMERFI